jgi:hypothetical protein
LGEIANTRTDARMSWTLKPPATLADLATIELRRITDVLQVEHASLHLRDPDHPHRAVVVAETGLAAVEALPDHSTVLGRVLQTARVQAVHRGGAGEDAPCAALAAPLVHDERAVGALLVVSRRESRRLGAIDAKLVGDASETLVERMLATPGRLEPRPRSDRFTRGPAPARR